MAEKRYDTDVLVVPTAVLEEHGCGHGLALGAAMAPYHAALAAAAEYRDRDEVENDPAYKQVIPYTVITGWGTVYRYRRPARGGEPRLSGKTSIGVGGHIEASHAARGRCASPHQLGEAIVGTATRELAEEVATPGGGWFNRPPRWLGFVNYDSDDVGRCHLGVVFGVAFEFSALAPREPEVPEGGMVPIADAAADPDLEQWSRILIDSWTNPWTNPR